MFEANIPVTTKCNTCKASFSTVELVRDHYRTDWHVFNSKRRANNLTHVTLEEYRRQFPAVKKKPTTITNASPPPLPTPSSSTSSSDQPKKVNGKTTTTTTITSPTKATKATKATTEQRNTIATTLASTSLDTINSPIKENNTNEITQSLKNLALELGVESERVDDIVTNALQQNDPEEDDDDESEEEEEEPIIIEPNVSIFDDKEFPTVEECFAYMELKFGLFIPEREYLIDLPGLLVYLGEKVKIGGICLYCQKQMRPGRPCQNHMMSKSHCKLAYQEGVDLDEYEDFYDFSSSYQNNGDDDEIDNEETLEISPIGELILTDGRTVGHRAFRKYYRQKHKPVDNRLAITIQRREDMLKFQSGNLRSTDIMALGLTSSNHIRNVLNGIDLRRLSDSEIMSLIVKKHKELKKIQQIEQREQKRHEYRHNRAEYLSTKDQLRAKINRTDKIRDYHGMLM